MTNIEAVLTQFEDDSEEQSFFKKLYEDKFDKSGILTTVKKRSQEAKNIVNEAIEAYFRSVMLMDVVLSAMEDEEVEELHDTFPLYLNMIKRYLPEKDSVELKPLGLSQEDLSEVLKQMQLSKTHHSLFVDYFERKLDAYCSRLLEDAAVFESVLQFVPKSDWRKSFDEAMKTLEYQAEILGNDEKLRPIQEMLKKMRQTYYKELHANASLLNKLLSLQEERLLIESRAVQYYSTLCEALQLKIGLFELRILDATYNQETVPALRKIRKELDAKAKNVEEELVEKQARFEEYQRLGETFESLVEEYTKLMKCITNAKVSYNELKRTEMSSDS
ncbi:HAUS augmin-like complex subunit 4 [Uloborus diversus]|uniref:HAUS augmin-like complex subunit 4 n=1 Tax=Uloborus diversus TaxID=327109 RepID=UPI0024090187|nr:HAUS augmin-like complex subunit 4 [Uloborus diversus]